MLLLRRGWEKIDFLKKVPIFSNLNRRHMKEILKHVDQVTVKAGTVLARQGNTGLEFVFIVEGKARVEKGGKVIGKIAANDFFGEISLIDGGRRTASIIAETDMTLLIVHKRSFSLLLDTIPELQKGILLNLCKYLRRAEADIIQ